MTTHVPQPRIYTRLRVALALGGSLLAALQTGTQVVAHQLGYHDILGVPLVDLRDNPAWATLLAIPGAGALLLCLLAGWRRGAVVAGMTLGGLIVLALIPVYPPTSILSWSQALSENAAFRPLLEDSLVAATLAFMVALVGISFVTRRGFRLKQTVSHGSAEWGNSDALVRPSGYVLGTIGGKHLRYDGEGHLMTVAPTRSGKGVGPIVSTLLSYPGSVVVTDPKGENYAVTSAYRKDGLRQKVIAFDPFGVAGGEGRINPLDIIDATSPKSIDEARRLAETIVVTRGKPSANAAFFDEEARAFLSGLILYVCHRYPRSARSLGTVRELLTRGEKEFDDLLQRMSKDRAAGFGLVARTANGILQKDLRERSGVISTAKSHTHFLDSPQVAYSLSQSTNSLEDLKRKQVSLYLIIPMDLLDAYAALLRLIVTTAISAIVRVPGQPPHRVLLLLDEFANLGRMNSVLRAVTLLAGFGATVWMIVQNLPQLKGIYPDDWQVLLDVDVFQTFGSNDEMTSKYVSDLTGDTTVFSTTQANSRSAGKAGGGRQRSFTMAERQRKLLTPDEVRRLPDHEQLIFLRSHAPIRAERLRYFEDDVLKSRAAPHPIYGLSLQ
jgi:type IV secretion system protein VirD4